MKTQQILTAIIIGILLWLPLPAQAGDFTPEQAIDLARKGADLIEKIGVAEARKILHDPKGGYLSDNKELYVLVMNFKGEWVVYPPFPKTEGKSALNVKDVDGKLLVQDMIAMARDNGEGWVKYRWVYPPTGKIRPKETYVVRVGDMDLFSAVGIYP